MSVPTALTPQQDADYDYEERAAILEYDAHLPRHEAERRAREMTREQPELPMGEK